MKQQLWGRNSVTVKSLAAMVIFSTVILLCVEMLSIFSVNLYEKAALRNYRESLEMYCSYWDNKLALINNSLITLSSVNNADEAYWNVCYSQDELAFETGKTMLMRNLSDLAWNHQDEIIVFVYVPERNVFLKSKNHLVEMGKRTELDQAIREYAIAAESYYSSKWNYFEREGEEFFIRIYKVDENYVGAIVRCETVVGEMLKSQDIVERIHIGEAGEEGEEFLQSEDVLTISMQNIRESFHVYIASSRLADDKRLITVFTVGTILFGCLLLIWNMRFQTRNVLRPLNRLRDEMERFGRGGTEIHLEENKVTGEMRVLYHTFNAMTGQITKLKIDIYESELARERTQSNYMRLQIQPHFYTNILNLIYGLAQIRDYQAIQKLAMITGAYFRYLLGEKGTFVLLQEEIACVKHYIQIQQIRYKEGMTFTIKVQETVGNQPVLPMILQTFTENSVKHNITLVPMLHVDIVIEEKDEKIHMVIQDNGIGFEPDILEKLNRNESISEGGEHIGISNVKERLRLVYGDLASVAIRSRRGETVIEVAVPKVVTKEEENEYSAGR